MQPLQRGRDARFGKRHRVREHALGGGPLPVANYHSTISVGAAANGSALSWTGTYDAKGAPDADAKGVIDGIYAAGAAALTK